MRTSLALGLLLVAVPTAMTQDTNYEQERAILEVKRLGREISRLDLADGRQFIVLNLNNTKVTDTSLARLKGLSQIQRLYLGGTKVSDEGASGRADELEHPARTRRKQATIMATRIGIDYSLRATTLSGAILANASERATTVVSISSGICQESVGEKRSENSTPLCERDV